MKSHISSAFKMLVVTVSVLGISHIGHTESILGKINYELYGVVTISTCGVLDSESEKYVDLGKYATKNLANVGDKSFAVAIPFDLSNCPPNGSVNVTFSGNKDSINNELLAIENNINSAKNIAIEISDNNKKRIPIGLKSENMLVDQNGNLSTLFYANYIVTQNRSIAGLANANAQFTVEYD
ncbi:fimbrial protein [Acinetobacter sp. A-IN1]|uniref:Fimbrial protein n=2 Tax=Acinetobacter nematophilus TaxID=2994642 RepID=A0A9X3DVS6_9GAMM|nr:fimbrial protein [Acinetobacter nematophilus]MCX5469021.1 fimbrial protein [Acinetobacter nematophilus]